MSITSFIHPPTPLSSVLLSAFVFAGGEVRADPNDATFEIGGGLAFALLGSYDLGEALGGPAAGDDLGPGTLGLFAQGNAAVTPELGIGLEGGIAIGGLVRTEERYFGSEGDVGATSTVWARARVGWKALEGHAVRGRLGVSAGLERLAEASGAGSVRLDSIAGGPWAALVLGSGFALELHGDVHAPFRGEIGEQSGDPSGVFFSTGVRAAYLWGVGPR